MTSHPKVPVKLPTGKASVEIAHVEQDDFENLQSVAHEITCMLCKLMAS